MHPGWPAGCNVPSKPWIQRSFIWTVIAFLARNHQCIGSVLFVLVFVLVCFGLTQQRLQYIPRNMHTVFALLCFVVFIHWLIFPYPSGLLHWHCGNLTIAPVPAKQSWWIWINTSCELIMNDCITTTKQSTTKPCAYFLGYTVWRNHNEHCSRVPIYKIVHLVTSFWNLVGR